MSVTNYMWTINPKQMLKLFGSCFCIVLYFYSLKPFHANSNFQKTMFIPKEKESDKSLSHK